MHGHVSSGPAVRNVSHPVEIHVHDPSIETSAAIVRHLVPDSVIVIQTRRHGCHVLRGEVVKEGPKIFRWPKVE